MTIRHFQVDDLVVEITKTPKEKVKPKDLVFGSTFSDHMLEIKWSANEGWDIPRIIPLHNLSLHPSSMVLQYANTCFEGMKAYRDVNGKVRLFRPGMNMARFQRSAKRLVLPAFNELELLECIKKLLIVDEEWIPYESGYSLYIRLTIIATQESLGIKATRKATLFVITSPVGPYYKSGFAPIKLLADPQYVRAWPGGSGNTKFGGNYAPTVLQQNYALKKGCAQMLWLFGEDHEVTEVGTMNLFMVWINESGETELITAPLDGTILPGVTRDSILTLARERSNIKVVERTFNMHEIVKAADEDRIVEMFGTGTACVVSSISGIHYLGKDIEIPLKLGHSGELTQHFLDTILAIQYGEKESEWSVVIT